MTDSEDQAPGEGHIVKRSCDIGGRDQDSTSDATNLDNIYLSKSESGQRRGPPGRFFLAAKSQAGLRPTPVSTGVVDDRAGIRTDDVKPDPRLSLKTGLTPGVASDGTPSVDDIVTLC